MAVKGKYQDPMVYSKQHPGYNKPVKIGDTVVWNSSMRAARHGPARVTKVRAGLFGTEYDTGCAWSIGGGCYCVVDYAEETPKDTLQTFPTGALREPKDGKGRPDLLLAGFPRALAALTRHMDCPLGRERNWEKGLPETSLVGSQFRHLLGYTSGVSEDTPEYNLTANLWNAIVLLETYLRVQDGVLPETLLDIDKETADGETH